MNEDLKVSIVILAAGASNRMGKPKQLLPWKNSNLINHTVNTAMCSKAEDVYVVLGAYYDEISQSLKGNDLTIIHNEDWAKGMGTSIAKAIDVITEKKHSDAILVMLADQPFVSVNDINKLINTYLKHNTIVASAYNKIKFGVPAIFNKTFYNDLLQLDKDDGAKSILIKNESIIKKVTLEHAIIDIDTKDDYNTYFG